MSNHSAAHWRDVLDKILAEDWDSDSLPDTLDDIPLLADKWQRKLLASSGEFELMQNASDSRIFYCNRLHIPVINNVIRFITLYHSYERTSGSIIMGEFYDRDEYPYYNSVESREIKHKVEEFLRNIGIDLVITLDLSYRTEPYEYNEVTFESTKLPANMLAIWDHLLAGKVHREL
jgi:hypothetical protein